MKLILDACNNHIGNMDIIDEMIHRAASLGAYCIKFQLFTNTELNEKYPNYDKFKLLYSNYELDVEKVKKIIRWCKMANIKPGFTIFSESRIKVLVEAKDGFIVDPLIKIASPDFTNTELILKVHKEFGWVEDFVISTGMACSNTLVTQRQNLENQLKGIKFLYCVSRYPCPISEIDFCSMIDFDGFSDHTDGVEASKRAIDLNMEYIERHFTLSKNLPGKDQKVSVDPDGAKELVEYSNYVTNILNYKRRWVRNAN